MWLLGMCTVGQLAEPALCSILPSLAVIDKMTQETWQGMWGAHFILELWSITKESQGQHSGSSLGAGTKAETWRHPAY